MIGKRVAMVVILNQRVVKLLRNYSVLFFIRVTTEEMEFCILGGLCKHW